MLSKIKYVVVFLFFSFTVLAQSPGYMGKHFVAGYGFYTSLAMFGSNAQGNSIIGRSDGNASTGEIALNVQHEGFIECALSKRMSIGVSTRFYKTTYDNARSTYAEIKTPSYYGYYSTQSVNGDLKGLFHIKGINFTLYGKLYFRNSVAPWGKYIMFGPTIRSYACSYDTLEMKIAYSSNYTNGKPLYFSDFGPQKQRYTRFDLSFGLGRNRILFNRLTLDYGLNVQVFALLATFFDTVSEGTGMSQEKNTDYMRKSAPWRVRGVNRANVFLKIGVLF